MITGARSCALVELLPTTEGNPSSIPGREASLSGEVIATLPIAERALYINLFMRSDVRKSVKISDLHKQLHITNCKLQKKLLSSYTSLLLCMTLNIYFQTLLFCSVSVILYF